MPIAMPPVDSAFFYPPFVRERRLGRRPSQRGTGVGEQVTNGQRVTPCEEGERPSHHGDRHRWRGNTETFFWDRGPQA
jgi:hypothetical protein